MIASCSLKKSMVPVSGTEILKKEKISPLGYTIQAGAFANAENAEKMTAKLTAYGLEAYFFVYKSGLYKVRFGDFASRNDAISKARQLQDEGIIEEYYIVRPDEMSYSRKDSLGETYIRSRIVKTAKSFLGISYKWGGTSGNEGFDCSGLAMSVYRLNGFNLPRTSRLQYEAGEIVESKRVAEGDLVFFDTKGKGGISHVGIYTGDGSFIHAPGTGKKVRTDSLLKGYFKKCYAGARSYL